MPYWSRGTSRTADIEYWLERIESGKRVRKPRTNREAAEFWAAHILTSASPYGAHLGEYVNSIDVSQDTIYSFGRHYPMGKIIRDTNGRCVRVVLNADRYPHRGWADTPGDQWNVQTLAEQAVDMAPWKIKLEKIPLTSYAIGLGIPVRTHDDPEPERDSWTVIPPLFTAWNPGPEPVQDRSNCIAGRVEEYSHEVTYYNWDESRRPAQAHPRVCGSRTDAQGVKTFIFEYVGAANGYLVWGDSMYEWDHKRKHPEIPWADVTYKCCPCCKAFHVRHQTWKDRYEGSGWGRFAGRGWRLYSEMIEQHGSRDGWREARRQDVRQVRKAKAARKAWESRNYIPLEAVSRDKFGIPILRDGFAMRKDADAYFKQIRETVRIAKRLQREVEHNERERARIRRFHERMSAARRRRRERSFFGTAERLALNLREIRELSSDNNEPGGSQ